MTRRTERRCSLVLASQQARPGEQCGLLVTSVASMEATCGFRSCIHPTVKVPGAKSVPLHSRDEATAARCGHCCVGRHASKSDCTQDAIRSSSWLTQYTTKPVARQLCPFGRRCWRCSLALSRGTQLEIFARPFLYALVNFFQGWERTLYKQRCLVSGKSALVISNDGLLCSYFLFSGNSIADIGDDFNPSHRMCFLHVLSAMYLGRFGSHFIQHARKFA